MDLHAALGHDRQGFQMDLSSVPQDQSLRTIELLGTEVAPLVHEALPRAAGRPRRCSPSPEYGRRRTRTSALPRRYSARR